MRNKSAKMKIRNQGYERTYHGGIWGGTEFMSLGVEVMDFIHL